MTYVIKTGKTVDEAVNEALKELKLSRDKVNIEILQEASKGFLGFGSKDAAVKVSEKEDTKDILKEIFSSDLESEKSNKVNLKNKKENKTEVSKNSEFSQKNLIEDKKIEENKEKAEENKVEKLEEDNSEEDSYDYSLNEEEFKNLAKEFIEKVMTPLNLEYELETSLEENVLTVNILGDEKKLGIVIGKRGVTLDAIQYLLSLIINKHSDRFVRVIVDSSGYRQRRKQTLESLSERMAKKVVRTNRSVRLEPMNAHERKIIHEALQNFEGVLTHSEGTEPYRRIVIQRERKY